MTAERLSRCLLRDNVLALKAAEFIMCWNQEDIKYKTVYLTRHIFTFLSNKIVIITIFWDVHYVFWFIFTDISAEHGGSMFHQNVCKY